MTNPFTLSFGKKPLQYISRISQTEQIITDFSAEYPSNQIYMITGVRGSGKTVMMTNISETLAQDKNWITVELNPNRDLLQSLAAKLYAIPELYALFIKAKWDFSAFGLGVSIENAAPVTDIENVLERMLSQIQKIGKRLLITVDEVTNSESMRIFASSFQIFLRKNDPIFMLMTGLYENIYNLQNEKTLTFLYRAPKIMLEPLNAGAIFHSYKSVLHVDDGTAEEMTKLTRGYPFAYQVLGYLYYREQTTLEQISSISSKHTGLSPVSLEPILPEYDQYLDEYVYSKIWSELSAQDRNILIHMVRSGETKVKTIRDDTGISSAAFSVYRDRLKKKGVLDTSHYGQLSFILPRFENFVIMQLI